jgi:hypothetical protein
MTVGAPTAPIRRLRAGDVVRLSYHYLLPGTVEIASRESETVRKRVKIPRESRRYKA